MSRYEDYTGALIDELFPLKTVRMRDNEPPWITDGIRALSRRKKRAYRRGGKSAWWARLQQQMDDRIEQSKVQFVTEVEKAGPRAYFAAVKSLASKEKPVPWQVGSLFEGLEPKETANKTAEFFTKISNEFRPIQDNDGNFTPREPLSLAEVEAKMKAARKPNSMVKGDVLPRLMKKFHKMLSVPAARIFNKVLQHGKWPSNWKKETAVIIPKTPHPSSLSETRNISCTSFLSKVLEAVVLEDLRKEIPLDPIQYGGIKGCSVDHLLVDLWDSILRPMDNN